MNMLSERRVEQLVSLREREERVLVSCVREVVEFEQQRMWEKERGDYYTW